MSLIAASQNQAMSPSARFRSSSKVSMPCLSMKRLSRLFSITSGLGSQITSPMTTGCTRPIVSVWMRELPDDFADTRAGVLEPGHGEAAAEIIEGATRLHDGGLRLF